MKPWVVLAIACVARVAWSVWAWLSGVRPASDAGWYYQRGLEIASGSGYSIDGHPTAYWPVGYPAFLGGLFSLFGDIIPVAMGANVLLGVAIVEATRRLALMLFKDKRSSWTAALIVALHPNGIAYSSLLLGETLSTALLLWSLVFLLGGRSVGATAASALLLAGAILVRPQLALTPAIAVLAACFIDTPRWSKSLLARSAFVYVGGALLLLPWTLRNQSLYDAWPVLSNNDGINLYIGNNPRANGTYYLDDVVERAYWEAPDEWHRNGRARRLAVAWITEHPGEFIQLIPRKLWYLWRGDGEGFGWNRRWFPMETASTTTRILDGLKWASQLWWVLFVGAAGYSVLTRRKGAVAWSWIGLLVAGWISLLGIVYFGDSRFHFVAIPFLALYIGVLRINNNRTTGES